MRSHRNSLEPILTHKDVPKHCPSCKCFVGSSQISMRTSIDEQQFPGHRQTQERREQGSFQQKILWIKSVSPKPRKIIMRFISPQRPFNCQNFAQNFEYKKQEFNLKQSYVNKPISTQTTVTSPILLLDKAMSPKQSVIFATESEKEDLLGTGNFSFRPELSN